MNMILNDSEIQANGQQVITACAFIHQKIDGIEKVFLPKRADTKKFLPKVYELPGGHVDFGEDPVVGLKREIYEELSMEVEVGDVFSVFTYTNEIKGSHSIEVIYFAHFTGDYRSITLHPEDHSEYGWFAEDELVHAATPEKGLEDDEFMAMKKGFALLNGESMKF